jgi:alkyldihydroxyacetonephosphate synthase
MQSGFLPSFVRLFDEEQSAVVFSHLGADSNGAILIMSWEEREFRRGIGTRVGAEICPRFGGKWLGSGPAKWWWDRRLSTSGLLRTQHKVNCFADTIEVAAPWSRLRDVHSSMRQAMKAATGESGSVFGHVAHAYPTGADIYMIFHGVASPGCLIDDAYEGVVEAAVAAALGCGATLSHHHGIGLLRNKFLRQEYGDAGFRILAGIANVLDPTGTFNPGKLGKK